MTHTFVCDYKGRCKTFVGEDYEAVSQEAWQYMDSFSCEVWENNNLDPENTTVTYNGIEHTVRWDLAGNLCEIYPAVFGGKLERW